MASGKSRKYINKEKSAKKWNTFVLSTSEVEGVSVTHQIVPMEASEAQDASKSKPQEEANPSGDVTPVRGTIRARRRTKNLPDPPTVIIIRRPYTSPQVLTVNDVGNLVSHLSRRKISYGSASRREHEQDFQANAAMRNSPTCRQRYEPIHTHIPNTWRSVNSTDLKGIVSRLTRATHSTASRADAQIYQRKVTEAYKHANVSYDIGLSGPGSQTQSPTPTPRPRTRSPLSFHRRTLINNLAHTQVWSPGMH